MNIKTGTIVAAQKVVIYGPEGIGKTSFAAQFPDPLFIDTEGGTKHLDVKRADPSPTSWTMLLGYVSEVASNPSLCGTLVLDTADWAEQLCIEHVCGTQGIKGIEDMGWGKGYTYVKEEFGRLLNKLQDVVEHGVNVVVCAHSQIKKFEQPDEMGSYDRYELKLSKQTSPLLKEWCDMLLFANFKTIVTIKDNGKGKAQGNRRVMHANHAAAWDAKNRCGLADEIPLDYAQIAAHIPCRQVAKQEPAQVSAPTSQHEPAKQPTQPTEPTPAKSTAANVKVAPASASAPPVKFTEVEPEHLKPLRDLMAKDGINDAQLQDACGAKGWCTADTPMSVYPENFTAYLVSSWGSEVLPTVESRKPYTDELPF